ncbi:unnamed protein product [Schistosoma curassoni]|uniref:Transcriptional regulator n=1 Tax=Schistosoma curassoni TaxID=6186 RepID=A0A183KUE8_9TREM|nr:unnamed protein product [Schistosoma curassoni]
MMEATKYRLKDFLQENTYGFNIHRIFILQSKLIETLAFSRDGFDIVDTRFLFRPLSYIISP